MTELEMNIEVTPKYNINTLCQTIFSLNASKNVQSNHTSNCYPLLFKIIIINDLFICFCRYVI